MPTKLIKMTISLGKYLIFEWFYFKWEGTMTSWRFFFSHFVSEIRFLAKISLKKFSKISIKIFRIHKKIKFSNYDFSFLLNSYFLSKIFKFLLRHFTWLVLCQPTLYQHLTNQRVLFEMDESSGRKEKQMSESCRVWNSGKRKNENVK